MATEQTYIADAVAQAMAESARVVVQVMAAVGAENSREYEGTHKNLQIRGQ